MNTINEMDTKVKALINGKKLIESYFFNHNNMNIFLDVKNVNYYEIDEITTYVIKALNSEISWDEIINKYSFEQITNVINDLEENNVLISGEQELLEPEISSTSNIVNVVLNVAHDCNLRCRYCFASTGHYKGKREFMSEEVAYKAIEWFVDQSGDAKNLNMHFFGGEPLLNLSLVKKVIDYVHVLEDKHDKRIFMNICTNGTILDDEIIKIIKDNEIGLQISLDGPPEIHDKYRPFPDGNGSYKLIRNNLERLFKEIPVSQIIPRATIPHDHVRINDVVNHLFDIGFKIVFFIPALGCGNYVVNKNDLKLVREEYDLLAENFLEKTINGIDYNIFPFSTEVQSIGNGIKRLYGCGAGLGFASIAINGDIYPCMRFTNNINYLLGNVFTGFNKEKRDLLFNRRVDQREKCKSCWARYLCGGACISIPTEVGKSIMEHDDMTCEVAQHIVKLSMYVNAVLSKKGIEYDKSKLEVFDFMRRRFQ